MSVRNLHQRLRRRSKLWAGVILRVSLALLVCRPNAAQEDATRDYISGLLDRGLVQVAENEAIRRLEDPYLKSADRVTWSIALAQAYMRHAGEVSGDDRKMLATRAEQTLAELLTRTPAVPRQEEIRTQQALLRAEHANLLAWEFQQEGGESRRTAATTTLEAAIQTLRSTLDQLEGDVRTASRRTPAQIADGELGAGDIRRLQREVESQLATALVAFVEVALPGIERSKAMHEADQRLQELADGWVGELRTWEARILRARLAQIRSEPGQAVSIVTAALKDQPAQWLADRLTAELVRAQLAEGKIDAALQRLLEHRRSSGFLSDELRAIQVEALLQARRLAEQKSDTATADELWLEAQAVTRSLSGNWRTRAETLLGREKDAARYGPEVAQLVQAAREAYQEQDWDRSLALFRQASERTVRENQPLAADEFDYTRGSILVAQERFGEAIDVLDALQQRSPVGPYARDADLLRAYVLGRQYAQTHSPELRDRYRAALSDHRQKYAASESATEAAWMLAAFEEGLQQWTEALALYLTLAEDPQRGPQAQLRATVLYETIIARLRELRQPVDAWEDRAAEDIAAFVRSFPQKPDQLTSTQGDITLRLVRLVLSHREHLYTQAEQLLLPVLQAGQHQRRIAQQAEVAVPDKWSRLTRTAAQLRIVALAGQGRMDEAQQLFHELAITDPETLLSLLQGLSDLTADIPAAHRQELAHLQLDTAQEIRLQQPELTPKQRRSLDESIADAYLAAGNLPNAIAFYEKLLKQSPRNRSHLRTVAELLQQTGEEASIRRAKSYWQRYERTVAKGTPEWFEARLSIAACAISLGEKEQARKLIGLTRLVYPELGGMEMTRRFEALEASVIR